MTVFSVCQAFLSLRDLWRDRYRGRRQYKSYTCFTAPRASNSGAIDGKLPTGPTPVVGDKGHDRHTGQALFETLKHHCANR